MSRPKPAEPEVGPDLDHLQAVLGHRFRDVDLLDLALTHESYSNERNCPFGNNERLEFLGDSVLGMVVCRYLYDRHPHLSEGRLAQIKASLVSTTCLARQARSLSLDSYLRLGRGELLAHGGARRNIQADTLEAVIGALFIDGGMEAARRFVLSLLQDSMDRMEGLQKDFKSLLQEHTQRLHKTLPLYRVMSEEGPPHERTFIVEVSFLGEPLGQGVGRTKREAGQSAAQEALDVLRRRVGFDLDVLLLVGEETENPVGEATQAGAAGEVAGSSRPTGQDS